MRSDEAHVVAPCTTTPAGVPAVPDVSSLPLIGDHDIALGHLSVPRFIGHNERDGLGAWRQVFVPFPRDLITLGVIGSD